MYLTSDRVMALKQFVNKDFQNDMSITHIHNKHVGIKC